MALMYRPVPKVLMVLQIVDFQTKQLQYKVCIDYGEGELQQKLYTAKRYITTNFYRDSQ